MKTARYILALGAFFVLSVALSACGSGVPGDAVANVAGNPITTGAFNHWMYVAAKTEAAQNPGAPVIVPTDPPDFKACVSQVRQQVPTLASTPAKQIKSDCSQLFMSLSGQVMDFLIKAYWYQAEATRQHVKVTNNQVQQAFATAKQQQFPNDSAFQQFLTQTGQTVQDILFRFRVNQIFTKLVQKHSAAPVTSTQVEAYYRSHMSQFGSPETRDLRVVLTKAKAQADAAKGALSKGGNWNAVAKQYSIDPTTKNNGGQLVGIKKGQQDSTLDQAAFSAPLNKLMGPVQGQFGFYVFQVTKITKGTQQTLAQATPSIQSMLTRQQQTNAQQAVDNQAKKHWLHQTQCRKQYAMSDCKGYKAPKSSATSSSSSG